MLLNKNHDKLGNDGKNRASTLIIVHLCAYIYINFHASFGSEHLQVNNLQFYDLAEHVCQVDLKGIHYIKACMSFYDLQQ